MISRLRLLAAVCADSGIVVAGCGSSSNSRTTSQLKAAEAANPAVAQAVAQAVTSCKTSINAEPSLTADDKTKLDAICQRPGNGTRPGSRRRRPRSARRSSSGTRTRRPSGLRRKRPVPSRRTKAASGALGVRAAPPVSPRAVRPGAFGAN